MTQLHELSRPFSGKLIKPPPPGGHGNYVKHSTITERLLSVVGPFDYEIQKVIRGYAPAVVGKTETWPARDNAVVGCVARLTITIDDRMVSISEVGDVDQPAMNGDGRNLKDASSDAIKRCAMRVGLGLHMWSQELYFLESQLSKNGDEV